MKNYVQDGDVITLAAPYDVLSGAGAQVGTIFGVAAYDALSTVNCEFAVEGVFELKALSTSTGSIGDRAYWDNINKRVDTDPSVGIWIGSLTVAKTNGQVTATVLLKESGSNLKRQPTPATATVAATLTIAQLMTGLINATPTATGATAAYTLPTGAAIDAAYGGQMQVDDSFDWVLINNALAAADTITVTANTAHTIVGGAVVQSLHASTGAIMGYSSLWRTRKTAAATYVSYRIA